MLTKQIAESHYPFKPLSKVADFLDHLRKPVKQSDRKPGPYPYYGANGQQGTIDGFLFDEPLILLAEDGGHFDQPERGIAYTIEGKTWVNNHAHILKPNTGIDYRYLFQVLRSYDVNPFISGSTRKKLTKGQAGEISIPLPPLPEQKRIAAILDQADALRRQRQRALDQLDQLGQSIFYDMFGDPTTNPKRWPVGTIRDLIDEAKYGTSKKANTSGKGMPILRMGNITYDGQIDLSDIKHVEFSDDEFPKYTTKAGDILFNRTNSKELVGKTAVVRQSDPLAIAGYLVRARTNSLANPHYISGYLNSPHGKLTLNKMCNNIVGMANINAQKFQDIKILMPPPELQNEYAKKLDEIELRKSDHFLAFTTSEALFASLQQRAFRGEL